MSTTQHPNDPKGAVGATKCPMHLLPPAALREVAWVHGHGAEKYGPYNWRESKVNATTYVAAILRHLAAWSEGEDLDPESGRSHIAHVATSCNILIDAAACGKLIDDRVKRDPYPELGEPPDFTGAGRKSIEEYLGALYGARKTDLDRLRKLAQDNQALRRQVFEATGEPAPPTL